MSRYAAAMCK